MNLFQLLLCFLTIAANFSNVDAVHIGIVTSKGYVGDREAAWRIKIAAERLGWIVSLDETSGKQIKNERLDWVICMLPKFFLNPHCPNYLMVFHPFSYLDEQRRFLHFYKRYDGYLLTINDRKTLEDDFHFINKEFNYISFYPTVYSIPYRELALNDLMVMIPVWSSRITSPNFNELYNLLSLSGFTKFYGVQSSSNFITNDYIGSIPFDGISVIDILQKHGLVLVIHSEIHNQEGIPTSRIFEAAAASTVIISDQNPFVKKYFGDSVFYIDTSGSGEEMYSQILEHLHTIHQNPSMALEMAKKAHQIFVDNFTMEQQLLTLESMHQKVMSQKSDLFMSK